MQILPFLLSTGIALICFILSAVSLSGNSKNTKLQGELLVKQTEIQELNLVVSVQNDEYNRQTQAINAGANVAQKLGPPILRDMGYLAAKNKNEKLKMLLVKQRLEAFIPSDEDLKKIDKQLEEARSKQGKPAAESAPAPAPSTAPR